MWLAVRWWIMDIRSTWTLLHHLKTPDGSKLLILTGSRIQVSFLLRSKRWIILWVCIFNSSYQALANFVFIKCFQSSFVISLPTPPNTHKASFPDQCIGGWTALAAASAAFHPCLCVEAGRGPPVVRRTQENRGHSRALRTDTILSCRSLWHFSNSHCVLQSFL